MYSSLQAIAGDAIFAPTVHNYSAAQSSGHVPGSLDTGHVPGLVHQFTQTEEFNDVCNYSPLNDILGLDNGFVLPTPTTCKMNDTNSDTCHSYQGTMHGDYMMSGGYMHYDETKTSGGLETSGESVTTGGSETPGGSMQFDDPDLDDEFFAYHVIRNVDFPGHVG